IRAEDLVEQINRGAIEILRREDRCAWLKLAGEDRRMERGHTTGIGASGGAFFKHAHGFFKRCNSGIAVARIDVALLLSREYLVHFGHGIISERGGRIDWI